MGNLISLFIFLGLIAACGKNLPTNLENGTLPGGNAPYGETPQFLNGTMINSAGQPVVLNERLQKPLVLIFSQDSCLVCRAETKMLSEKFTGFGGPPRNIDLHTVLVGAILEDTQDFKQGLGIQWDVSFQTGDSFFRSLCPALKVPCVIVELPARGISFQKTGEFQVEELEKYTGAWSY